jgi:DNA repair ATPase RecN
VTNPVIVKTLRKALTRLREATRQSGETAALAAFRTQSDALQRNVDYVLAELARESDISREPLDDALRNASDTIQGLSQADARVRSLLELVGSIRLEIRDVREREGNRVSESDLTALKRIHFTGLWDTTQFRAFRTELSSIAGSFDALRAFRMRHGI